jgi:hypothetical protein
MGDRLAVIRFLLGRLLSAAFLAVDLAFALVFFAPVPAFLFPVFALLATFFFTTFLTAAFFLPAFRVTAFFLATFRVTAFFCGGFFVERFFAVPAVRAGFFSAFLATFLPAAGRRVGILTAAFLRDGFGAVLPRVFLTAFFAAIVRASKEISRSGRLYIRLGSEEAFRSQKSRKVSRAGM